MRNTFFILFAVLFFFPSFAQKKDIDISGIWTVKLDSSDVGIKEKWQSTLFDKKIHLPGTTDKYCLGNKIKINPTLGKENLQHLSRKYKYVGPAWYSREIQVPENWKGKELFLNLERLLWDSQVWIDNIKVKGHEESLTTPHRYNLTPYLKCGKKHIICVRVDNRQRHDISVKGLAHAYTDHTQILWNGILGEMKIEAIDKVYINDVKLYPNIKTMSVKAVVEVNNTTDSYVDGDLNMYVSRNNGSSKMTSKTTKVKIKKGVSYLELVYEMGDNAQLWNEFNPVVYQAVVSFNSKDFNSQKKENFGLREIKTSGNKMMFNDKPLFLRGTLECCIFPLTGTPPTDKKEWKKVFTVSKSYGLNHLRFHSWCPPKAAFDVADEMGFYIQVELPVWSLTIGKDAPTIDFMKSEAERMLKNYGNHPSFCLFSLGNELQSDFNVLSTLLDEIKSKDNRHLYTTTTFTFEKGHGTWPEKNDDYFITQWTKKGWVRGQGVFNKESPSFNKDFNKSVEGMEVPLITHEIGQYSVYPDLTEIKKYKGVLAPSNFIAVKENLKKKGLLGKAHDYLMASGKLASILYKEEIERALKTGGISGFQLLDLHDFPGQGTALVGLLNAFWDSKGIIDGKEFREFCAPVVPLLRFPKAVYNNDEPFSAMVELCNYGENVLNGKNIIWSISDGKKEIDKGSFHLNSIGFGYNNKLGEISTSLLSVSKASKLEVSLWIEGTKYKNKWNIWVYPKECNTELGKVIYTSDFDEAVKMLNNGETVLFNPQWKTTKGLEGKFVPVFWSPVHFPKQAGTMGVLCNPKHKALSHFPTDMHTDWQWWDLNINSTTLLSR